MKTCRSIQTTFLNANETLHAWAGVIHCKNAGVSTKINLLKPLPHPETSSPFSNRLKSPRRCVEGQYLIPNFWIALRGKTITNSLLNNRKFKKSVLAKRKKRENPFIWSMGLWCAWFKSRERVSSIWWTIKAVFSICKPTLLAQQTLKV